MKYETDAATGFSLTINGWLTTIFQHFLLSQTLIFDIANISNKCCNSMF